MSIRKKIFFSCIVMLMSIVLAELACFTILKMSNRSGRPLFFNFSSHSNKPQIDSHVLTYLDPHLGYAHNPKAINNENGLPGFAIYGEKLSKEGLRIVTFGGSTTDPIYPYCWPKQLHEMLNKKGIKNTVYNGGVSASSTSQEMIKLIRDGLYLKPDFVICLNGVNNMGFIHAIPSHPMVHPFQKMFIERVGLRKDPWLLPNVSKIVIALANKTSQQKSVTGISLGLEKQIDPADHWLKNIRTMRSICKEFDIHYFSFLQPIMGYGSYQLNEKEKEMLSKVNYQGDYHKDLNHFFDTARSLSKKYDYIFDITKLFDDKKDMYEDPRHPNEAGHGLVAQKVYEQIHKTLEIKNK